MNAENERKFVEILESTHHAVRAHVAGAGVRPGSVDDIAQEVYLEFYRNFEKMPDGVAPLQWLKGIARNLCNSHFRREKRRNLHWEQISSTMIETQTAWEEASAQDNVWDAMEFCLGKLTGPHRKFVALRYEQGMSVQDLARREKVHPQTARVTLFRIRKALKDCITERMQWNMT